MTRPMSSKIIPVTYNRAEVGALAPRHSYINALDFQGPRELAAYLKQV